jgi:hypothetical protein
MENLTFWVLGAYVMGTVMGYLFFKTETTTIVESTIDSLIENGYLKSRTNENGEVELLKIVDEV